MLESGWYQIMEFWIGEMQALLPERTNQFINVLSLFVYIIIVINAEMG
jgi:hypothetical protein